MDHEAKARELAERGWLGEWEYEEEREDAIHEVATALREERARVIEECAKVVESYADMDYGLAFSISRRIRDLKDDTKE